MATRINIGSMFHRQDGLGISGELLRIVCLSVFLILAAVRVDASAPLRKVTLMTLWLPQSQFAGYYVAVDKGIYRKHGIELTILDGGPGQFPLGALRGGKADFAVMWLSTALQGRDSGIQLVHVAQVVRKSAMMLVSKRSSGIRTPEEMQGRKVGLWNSDLSIPPKTLFSERNIHVREVPLAGTVNIFLRGGIDITSAMWYNEYHVIIESGVDAADLNSLFLSDYNINYPEDGIYATEKNVQENPALVDSFVAASLEGWQYSFDHPEEAIDIVMKRMLKAHIPANRVHQKWMLNRMQDIILPSGGRPIDATLDKHDYEKAGASLRKAGIIRHFPDYVEFVRSAHGL